jgi:GNAT superfamily N-acetyltransferase
VSARLSALLREVAAGRPPAPDGAIDVLPQPDGPVAAVLSFTAHHVVAADVDPEWVHARLDGAGLSAPMGPRFLAALCDVLGREPDSIDLVLVATGDGRPPALPLVPGDPDPDHPRAARADRYRTGVRAWRTPGGEGLLLVGRGLAGRWEAAFEVDPAARGRGLGRALAAAAVGLVPAGEPVWVQVAPGNVASVRAVLAAGPFTPVGGEILFPATAATPG